MPLTRQRFFTRRRPSIHAARQFVTRTLSEWGYADRLEDIQLCVSEIATNALVHGVPPGRLFQVRIEAAEEEVRIEVRDSGSGRPAPQSPHADRENGRGLLLVGELADAWGDIEHAVGKTVWFTVKATQARGCAE
ncbi:ATP-binding protein [Streptomyces hygroscopicus subsp. sporocinereus]|uniref:ATP-binding protein n=1 Tax=Streptomyces hygroscopicus TaxID=1912 RepID=A0ABQ3TWI5_STRHY|nr:ATP-binding protein [Streptomyces hygroscopicus]GHJ27323.1 ATP-binding protein [Streptomyces hygroscopicus]